MKVVALSVLSYCYALSASRPFLHTEVTGTGLCGARVEYFPVDLTAMSETACPTYGENPPGLSLVPDVRNLRQPGRQAHTPTTLHVEEFGLLLLLLFYPEI